MTIDDFLDSHECTLEEAEEVKRYLYFQRCLKQSFLITPKPLRLLQERDELRNTLSRIYMEYPSVAGKNDCPPPPHACPKCEIYHLLEEFHESDTERRNRDA